MASMESCRESVKSYIKHKQKYISNPNIWLLYLYQQLNIGKNKKYSHFTQNFLLGKYSR